MRANDHMPNKAIEYQKTDACYLNLPRLVRQQIWESTGLGSGPLVWRNQVFDCEFCRCSGTPGCRNVFAEGPVIEVISPVRADAVFR